MHSTSRRSAGRAAAGLLALAAVTGPAAARQAAGVEPAAPVEEADAGLAELRAHARALAGIVETDAARELLRAVPLLPAVEPTTLHYRGSHGPEAVAHTRAEYELLAEDERAGLEALEVDTRRYYATFYGSPLASVRAFDLAAAHGLAGWEGRRVLDFGFGSVLQLRLLAACGAEAVGLEVMPLLRALYAGPRDQGAVEGPQALAGRRGRIELVFGRWPGEPGIAERVGGGFDLVVSKNTLKRGYVAPRHPVGEGQRLDLGVPAGEFLARVRDALAPGGLFLVYNLGSGPAGEGASYVPMADIDCPWPREACEAAGFEVLAFDEVDDEAARAVGRALGWFGEGGMQEAGLFARFTVLRRPE